MESSSRRGVNKQAAAREAVDVLHEIATLLVRLCPQLPRQHA
jgi:hypothetical protein